LRKLSRRTPVVRITKAPGKNQGLNCPTRRGSSAGATLKLTMSISESSCAPKRRLTFAAREHSAGDESVGPVKLDRPYQRGQRQRVGAADREVEPERGREPGCGRSRPRPDAECAPGGRRSLTLRPPTTSRESTATGRHPWGRCSGFRSGRGRRGHGSQPNRESARPTVCGLSCRLRTGELRRTQASLPRPVTVPRGSSSWASIQHTMS